MTEEKLMIIKWSHPRKKKDDVLWVGDTLDEANDFMNEYYYQNNTFEDVYDVMLDDTDTDEHFVLTTGKKVSR
tara:strand:+ start:402 stop:620 length:219 start_codon:yes stop_codon:yes gene_type:complete